ncbi:Heme-binding protein A [subsurface metagenome]
MKRNLLVAVLILALIAVFASFSFAEVKNPDTIINANIGAVSSLDPAYICDTVSSGAIYNVFDTLTDYKRGCTAEFVPMLSTEVPSVKNGLLSEDGLTYTFPIREGVKFHNGDILTPEDVEYSFERSLMLDRSGGPSWLLLNPILGSSSIEKIATKVAGVENYSDMFEGGDLKGELKPEYKEAMVKVFTDYVDKAVEVDGNKVIFHLPQPYASFLSIISRPVNAAAVIDKKWAIEQGAWDGKADTWWKYHDPVCEENPLFKIANGTGPFMVKKWIPGEILMLERFDDYWQGPAKVKNAQIKVVTEWTTRKLMLQTGDADIINVPSQYINEVKKMADVRVVENLPSTSFQLLTLNWGINAEGNALLGSGKLDGKGIPPDFFSDIHVRKGFSYLFPYEIYIEKVLDSRAIRIPGPINKPILEDSFDDPSLYYDFSLEKAKEEFKQAWDGQVWEKGFEFTICYTVGRPERKGCCDMISTYAKMLNPKFKITSVGLQLPAYYKLNFAGKLPMFTDGWGDDYLDPDNVITTHMASYGLCSQTYGAPYIEFAKKNVDPLCDKAAISTNPEERTELYKQLLKIAHDQAISIYLFQPTGNHVERTWVKGWHYNPIILGWGVDFYGLSKGE